MLRSIFSVAVMAVAAMAQAQYETEDSVLVLNDDNIASAIKEHEHILVEFYAPWCGHCKSLAPHYAEAAEFFEDNEDFDVALAKVDATENSKSAGLYSVSGYPTIKFFKSGDEIEYTGGRTAAEIIAWLKKKTGPPASVIESSEEIENIRAEEDVVIVFVSKEIEDTKAYRAFIKYANTQDNAAFAVTTNFSLMEVEDEEDTIVVLKNFDEGRAVYTGKFTASKIEAFVEPHLLPHVVEFNDEVAPKVFGGAIREHILYFRDASNDGETGHVEAFRTIAQEKKGSLLFVAVDTTNPGNDRIVEFFGLKDFPATRIIDIRSNPIKYAPGSDFDFTNEGFGAFVKSYKNNELKPHLNTESVPEDWDDEEVKIIVGENFNEVVLDETKNVLLMAHAPWCGHCKSLSPIWDQLGEAFEDNDDVIIAKMDATANEVEAFSAQSFPTLKFFPAGGEMIDYDGGRDLESLTAFVNEKIGVESEPTSEEGEDKDDEDTTAHDEL